MVSSFSRRHVVALLHSICRSEIERMEECAEVQKSSYVQQSARVQDQAEVPQIQGSKLFECFYTALVVYRSVTTHARTGFYRRIVGGGGVRHSAF